MRWILRIASLLVFLAGAPLLLVGDQTARFFAWTISPQITAAFLGASYWSAGLFQILASRERAWTRARLTVGAVLLFTTTTLVVTLVHISRFHFDFAFTDPDARATDPTTLVGTWAWLGIYLVVPIALVILVLRQLRVPREPEVLPARVPLGPIARVVVVGLAAVLASIGGALLLAPTVAGPIWPWKLTALTARAIGAWLLGLSVTGVQVLFDDDRGSLGPVGLVAVFWSVLQLAIVVAFRAQLAAVGPALVAYVAIVVGILGIGASAAHGAGTERGTDTSPQRGDPPP